MFNVHDHLGVKLWRFGQYSDSLGKSLQIENLEVSSHLDRNLAIVLIQGSGTGRDDTL